MAEGVSLPTETRVTPTKRYLEYWQRSITSRDEFWSEHARALEWFKTWDRVLDDSNPPFYKWFVGGQINASYNAVDRHVKTWRRNKVAYMWEGDDPSEVRVLTYHQLYREVNRFAKVLENIGIKDGDRITIYLPMIPELPIAMLACSRIGAIHSVVFSGFSSDALADRINDAQSKVLITADGGFRRGKIVPLKEWADVALEKAPSIEKVIVVKRTGESVDMKAARDRWLHDLLEEVETNAYVKPKPVESTHPLYILYTSGTTGKPKGVEHGTGGYLVWTYWTLKWVFDVKEEDTWWCTADIGWITGHSYDVYAPLMHGLTSVIYEGAPDYPKPDRWWDMIERYGVSILYTTPTAIRMFMRHGEEWVKMHNLDSLRILGTVGEPINPEAWVWYYKVVGGERCPIMDTWWQTETGGFMIAPAVRLGPTILKPGSAAYMLPGIKADVLDDEGKPVEPGQRGYLVIKAPWPGMLQGLWRDPDRYVQVYFSRFPGAYYTGDYAIKDEEGYFWLLGRADEVLKVAGHRLGTMEIESALVSHPAVAEAAVVGKPDPVKGEVPVAIVILRSGYPPTDGLKEELKQHVRKTLGPIAKPHSVLFVEKLPKTRSGKIMRRLVKGVIIGAPLGDMSTIEDEASIDEVKRAYEEFKKRMGEASTG
jgi:acetyl-CoA synthetase